MALRVGAGGPRDPGRVDRAAARAGRQGDAAANVNSYGTTLRIYDPRIDAWHIQWTDPVTQTYFTMIGRTEGDTIVQHGKSPTAPNRWSFADITSDSLLWRGELSSDEGATWRVNVEFTARRNGAGNQSTGDGSSHNPVKSAAALTDGWMPGKSPAMTVAPSMEHCHGAQARPPSKTALFEAAKAWDAAAVKPRSRPLRRSCRRPIRKAAWRCIWPAP